MILCIILTSLGLQHETYCVQLLHRHGSPTNPAALPSATRNHQISLTSSPPEIVWALYNSSPWGHCIKSVLLLLDDTSIGPSRHRAHVSKQSTRLIAGVKWVTAAEASRKQMSPDEQKSSSKGALLSLLKGHKVTLQQQFLQVVTEHRLGEYDDSWSRQSTVRAAHRQAAVPGDVTALWSEAECYRNTRCNQL